MEGSRPGFTTTPRTTMATWLLLVIFLANGVAAADLRISNKYSPLNRYRPAREHTGYIVLHTTEGGDRSSLRRVRKGGLAHYIVMSDGRVHRVVKRQLVARHAGCSMWDGIEDLDLHSIGIEVVGWHNKPLKPAQIAALRELVRQLQSVYDLPDSRVLTHSMIAYGRPNRWHRHDHRGRKRCGMQFARPDLRRRLGLDDRPLFDPDVKAGRLIEADPYLATVLYAPAPQAEAVAQAEFAGPDAAVITRTRTAWFIARDQYDQPGTVYVFPNGERRRGDEIDDWSRMPAGTRVLLDQDVPEPAGPFYVTLERDMAASELVGEAYDLGTTVYVRPDGRVTRGDAMTERDFRRLPPGTRVFLGFEYAGKVTRGRTAYAICGQQSRRDSTLYLLPSGRVRTGDEISERRIPGGTHVLVRS